MTRRAALSVGAAAVLAPALFWSTRPGRFADYRTRAGETRRLTLEEGSTVDLAAGSALSLTYGPVRRGLTPHLGEAYFWVASDPARPFVVRAGAGEVTALGTAFNIRLTGQDVSVSVPQHAVRARSDEGGDRIMSAGQGLVYGPGGHSDIRTLTAFAQLQDIGSPGGGGAPSLPATGTLFEAPGGFLPRSTSVGEPGFDQFDTRPSQIGFKLDQQLAPDWSVSQTLHYSKVDVDTQRVQLFCLTIACGPAEAVRYAWGFPETSELWSFDQQLRGRVQTGAARHDLLFGVDLSRERSHFDETALTYVSMGWDVFDPAYVGGVTRPPVAMSIDQTRRQAGLIAAAIALTLWNLAVLGPVLLLLLRSLVLFTLSDDGMRGLGMNATRLRLVALVLATLLAAMVTARIGVIGFIGLAAPLIAQGLGIRTLRGRAWAAPALGALLLAAGWIAMLLAQGAEVLLLDEPVSALDLTHQVEVMRLLRRLSHDRGVSVIMVLHDLNLAITRCDQAIALRSGALVAHCPVQNLINADLLRAIYGLDMDILKHRGQTLVMPDAFFHSDHPSGALAPTSGGTIRARPAS